MAACANPPHYRAVCGVPAISTPRRFEQGPPPGSLIPAGRLGFRHPKAMGLVREMPPVRRNPHRYTAGQNPGRALRHGPARSLAPFRLWPGFCDTWRNMARGEDHDQDTDTSADIRGFCAGAEPRPRGIRTGKDRLQGRVVDLCRLDALGLSRHQRHHGQMGRESTASTVEIVQINDYVESINQYTAGAFDGVSATNMDTLSIPSGSGVDTTALIVGRLFQRQRRDHPQGRGDAGGPRGQAREPRGTVGVPLPAGARSGFGRVVRGRSRRGPQHIRCRHDRGLCHGRRAGGGDVEPARFRHPGGAGREQAVRFLRHSRRDHRPAWW